MLFAPCLLGKVIVHFVVAATVGFVNLSWCSDSNEIACIDSALGLTTIYNVTVVPTVLLLLFCALLRAVKLDFVTMYRWHMRYTVLP